MTRRPECEGRAARPSRERFDVALEELAALLATCRATLPAQVEAAAALLAASLRGDGKILVCGNGGSAADAQHFAAELVGRFGCERRPMAAMSLATDTSVLSAIANDYGVEAMFSRQVHALGMPGDALLVLSTSGKSANILAAAATAKRERMAVVSLVGSAAEALEDLSDVCMSVPSCSTPRIQEIHTLVLHCLADALECALCEERWRSDDRRTP